MKSISFIMRYFRLGRFITFDCELTEEELSCYSVQRRACMHIRARLLERQAHCTCEIDLGSLRRRVFAMRIRVGLVSCNGDNVEKVKGRMKGGAAGQGRNEEFLSHHFRSLSSFLFPFLQTLISIAVN